MNRFWPAMAVATAAMLVAAVVALNALHGRAPASGTPLARRSGGRRVALSVSPATASLGTVAVGSASERDFRIHNDGNRAVVIMGLTPECSCLGASMASRRLAPGASALMRVSLRLASSEAGAFSKFIRINYADAKPNAVVRHVVVYLHGDAVPRLPICAFPGVMDFGSIAANSGSRRWLYIRAFAALSPLPKMIRISPGAVRVVRMRCGKPPARPADFRVRVVMDAGGGPKPGRVGGRIVFRLGHALRLVVPVRARIARNSVHLRVPAR